MASANDFKALEAGYFLNEDPSTNSIADKLAIEDFGTKETTAPQELQQPTSTSNFNKMTSLRYLFMTLALLSVFIVSLSSAAAVRPKDCHGQTAEEIKFQELLATISDEAIHDVLKEHISSKYKPGVWREGRTAMSAVHKDDAAQATSLAQLARRQNVSMTTEVETVTQPTISTVVVPPTSTPEPEPTTSADPEPTTSEATEEPTSTPEPTTEPTTEPTQDPTVSETSIMPPVTSTEATPEPTETETSITEAETETSAQTTEAPVSTETPEPTTAETSASEERTMSESSTNAPETTQTSAEPTSTPTSPSESVTPTSSEPQTTVMSTEAERTSTTVQTTTSRPTSSMVTTSRATTARSTTSNAEESSTTSEKEQSSTTQEVVFTTIQPDGSRSTITSYTIVPAAEATKDEAAEPTFTPEVQDAAASLSRAGFLGMVIVAITAMIAL